MLIGLIAIDVWSLPHPLAIIRLVLGLIYVLFIPGYTFQLALFPSTIDLDNTERIALSFALSGAIVPPIALFLNWLPWGIKLWPVVISLSVFILVCLVIATIRFLLLPAGERLEPKTRLTLRTWWAGLERQYRVVYIILVAVLATASLTAVSILVMPKPAEYFTEFYILNQEGLAEDYPRESAANQVISVTTGITNREGSISTYNIQIKLNDQVIEQAGPITLKDDATWEQPVEFSVPTAGDDQQILFILNREGQPSPYRTLRLWINVKPAGTP